MNQLPSNKQSSDEITRYIFDKSAFARDVGRVKYNALMPNPEGRTSVFHITNLSDNEIWDIGQRYVAVPRKRTLRARGDISVYNILEGGLIIEEDPSVHPLHANIIGWPEQKAKKVLVAKKLARKTTLHLKTSN